MTYFESLRSRMPHFFSGVDVVEYTPHERSKSIQHLFSDSRYFVVDPTRGSLGFVDDGSFNVSVSIDYFQHTPYYLKEFKRLHRVSSKFVAFSCSAAGKKPWGNGYYRNLTEGDFYNHIDLDSMFDSYKFYVDYSEAKIYFWGVKRNGV